MVSHVWSAPTDRDSLILIACCLLSCEQGSSFVRGTVFGTRDDSDTGQPASIDCC